MIKVAIVEDHQVLVDSLRLLLQTEPDLEFCGSARTVAEGEQLILGGCADVLLLDISLPDGNGLDLIPLVNENSHETKVVVLTSLKDEYTLLRAIDYGIHGYVSKSSSLVDLLSTIRKTAQGEIVIPPSLLIGLLKRTPRDRLVSAGEEDVRERLTPRETEILSFLAQGYTGDTIADELGISHLTVRTHIRNLMAKLGVHSRLEAVTYGMRNGLVSAMM